MGEIVGADGGLKPTAHRLLVGALPFWDGCLGFVGASPRVQHTAQAKGGSDGSCRTPLLGGQKPVYVVSDRMRWPSSKQLRIGQGPFVPSGSTLAADLGLGVVSLNSHIRRKRPPRRVTLSPSMWPELAMTAAAAGCLEQIASLGQCALHVHMTCWPL